jgi:hypothetical protein
MRGIEVLLSFKVEKTIEISTKEGIMAELQGTSPESNSGKQ